ncbi:MAG: PEP-CTERM sorting domain-containing protein [Armatimonadota bacterium]|nr:PEP-CTERM sorting domain-containing protein [Armatimonadota bacterium]
MRHLLLMVLALALCAGAVADTPVYLDEVPDYNWYHGCSPTSGGMVFGYWDRQTGYENLWDGTAPLYANDNDGNVEEIYQLISSDEHNSATYVKNECTHTNAPNSLGCFFHTDPNSGGSNTWNIATGMRRYAAWDDPGTGIDESYAFHSLPRYGYHPDFGSFNAGTFDFLDLVAEIDGGRPMLLDLSLKGAGHSVMSYGYWIDDSGDKWYAVRDTWQNGVGSAESGFGITATTYDGQEWWRWETCEEGESFGDAYFVSDAIYFAPDHDGLKQEDTDFGNSYDLAELIDSPMETVYASLGSTSDEDWYRIWLDQYDVLTAMTQDEEGYDQAVDTRIDLHYDPDLPELVYCDDFWGGSGGTYTSNLWWEAGTSGYYYLNVRYGGSGATGDYWLSTYRDIFPEPTTLAMLSLGAAVLIARCRRRR